MGSGFSVRVNSYIVSIKNEQNKQTQEWQDETLELGFLVKAGPEYVSPEEEPDRDGAKDNRE